MARKTKLTQYRAKRDFSKTKEPQGKTGRTSGFRYLIQKHAARRLHYDLRLELDGVLKSWAVTRGPSIDPQDKRLAVEVEDHPLEYGTFEGTIPKGQYGGGTVMLWDEGTWEPIGDPRKGLRAGKLEFLLHGVRLAGKWTLVRMRDREKEKRHNWLLIKRTDEAALTGEGDRLLEKSATSVASGRTMEEIAAGHKVWQRDTPPPKKVTSGKLGSAKLPAFFFPQLATLTEAMPEGDAWVHEIKFDGYRVLAYLNKGKVRLYTRTGKDWTDKFSAIAAHLAELSVDTAILDGEIVVADKEGVSSFRLLQGYLSEGKGPLQYYVFDLLFLNGKDLRKLTLLERKAMLETLLAEPPSGIFYSEHFAAGKHFLQRACALHLEGIISKRAGTPYRSGRGTAWVKTKCHHRQEFVVGGFTLPLHEGPGVGALLIGYYEEEKLVYAGKVGTGFNRATSEKLRRQLEGLRQNKAPFDAVPADGRRGARWVKPEMVCEVEFTEWTSDGRLRHPSFQGLREDKPAPGITRDIPKKTPAKRGQVTIEGIAVSHPDRVLYPGTDITKLRLAEYYLAVAEVILPHVAHRPLSMVRCPEGSGEECFFQRHITRGQSPYLHSTGIKVKGRNESYMMIKDVRGLLSLVQWGVIELHPWGCKADKPHQPDRIIFDLDPDPALPRAEVIAGAQEVRERMLEFGLESFLKTTGGKGLHVVVPLVRDHNWEPVKAFARAVAESMQHDNPQRYIAKASKAAREGKIFVDYLRNDLTATAVAAYSARAREGATVAMPLAWEELKPSLKSTRFTLETVPQILERRDDPWSGFFNIRQRLSSRYLRALKIA